MRLWRWLVAFLTLAFGHFMRRRDGSQQEPKPDAGTRRAELVVIALLLVAALWAVGFIVTYAEFSPRRSSNELLGICLGMALAFIAAALLVFAKALVPSEQHEEDYPAEQHRGQQQEILEVVHESGTKITRKRLLMGAGAAAGGALGLAALTPALSLGPLWQTTPLDQAPWRSGTRLVDEHGRPLKASEIEPETFYTAFPEGANPENIGSPLVVIRVDPAQLKLPAARAGWAPGGILAFSKICTHAGCAIALYRKPTFPVLEPHEALVCPCHYSTFDPFTGGTVIYGPAGRPLPQLPLEIDTGGYLRAAGNFSARVGPSWWNVRERPTNA
jgi:ubiquinol-cytochrome c reductase iron-sulfur subunit